jgi:tetratricopeptide (TPR) repeat protein
MTTRRAPWRIGLLAAALLAGCAASSPAPGQLAGLRDARGAASPFGAYLAGRFAQSQSDTSVAADQLLAALRADPEIPEVLAAAFFAAVLDGRQDALRLARRMPDQPIAAMLLLGADASAGRWERAEQRARALPRQGLGAVLQPFLTAWAQAGRGQADAALATLRPLTEQGRLRPVAALHAAMIADLAGRGPDALRLARLAVAESQEPNLRTIQIAAGILARQGREQEAARLFDGAAPSLDDLSLALLPAARRAALSGRAVASPVEGIAEAELALAAALRQQGAGEAALLLARLSLRLRPAHAPALLLAAETLTDESRYAPALALLEQVPEADPLGPVAQLRRGVLLDRLGRTDEAIAVLAALSAAQPQSAVPALRQGDVLRARERWQAAAAAYDTAIARLPNPQPADWPAFYARGIALERAGDWPRAEADFRRALQLSPEQPYVLNYLGYAWVEMGLNLPEARRMLERAVELRPNDGNIADSLGWALYKLGDFAGAVRWLERAVELEPQSSVINDHLGDAYWAAGRRAEAQFQWRRALSLDPEAEERPKIEAKLERRLPAAAAR